MCLDGVRDVLRLGTVIWRCETSYNFELYKGPRSACLPGEGSSDLLAVSGYGQQGQWVQKALVCTISVYACLCPEPRGYYSPVQKNKTIMRHCSNH